MWKKVAAVTIVIILAAPFHKLIPNILVLIGH